MRFLLYGAYGYTGRLIVAEAVRQGWQPVLAGRDGQRLQALAWGLPYRVVALEDGEGLQQALAEMSVVLHCAGPFAFTARPMVAACLATGTHYLDITGEVAVFEALAGLDDEARAAGVMLLPGAGFDVVPSDSLAVHLKRRLPTATHLELAFVGLGGGTSHGTAATMLYHLHRTGRGVVRRQGQLVATPLGQPVRMLDWGRGPRRMAAIPWGDVSTAYYSTGIPNITVYTRAAFSPPLMRLGAWLVRWRPLYRWLRRRLDARVTGPGPEALQRGKSLLWGQVRDEQGRTATAWMRTPNGYALTVQTALALVERALRGEVHPGFQTPARAYGPDWVLDLPGVRRWDGEHPPSW